MIGVIGQAISGILFWSTTFIGMILETMCIGLELDWATAITFSLARVLSTNLSTAIVSIFGVSIPMTAMLLNVSFSKN